MKENNLLESQDLRKPPGEVSDGPSRKEDSGNEVVDEKTDNTTTTIAEEKGEVSTTSEEKEEAATNDENKEDGEDTEELVDVEEMESSDTGQQEEPEPSRDLSRGKQNNGKATKIQRISGSALTK